MPVQIGHDLLCEAVDKYSDMVLRIAFHHTRNYADAEDVAQEVFLALMQGPIINDGRHLKSWLIRVAINKCRNLLKSAAKRKNASLEAAASKYYLSGEETGIIECIHKLSRIERDIVYLHYYEGFTAREVGEILGKKEDAVFTRLKRIRNKLKGLLEDGYEIY